jgi:hypothetical protein
VSSPSSNLASQRAVLRLQSLSWALGAAAAALVLSLLLQLVQAALLPELSAQAAASSAVERFEAALRAGGCGFFYGLLAFHLQRVDPDDSHLQAGLVGAVCGICSLASPIHVTGGLSTVMMELLRGWLPLWLPLVGSALLLSRLNRVVSRLMHP